MFIDMAVVDSQLPTQTLLVGVMAAFVFGQLLAIVFITPLFLVGLVILVLIFSAIQIYFSTCFVAIQRLESVSRSPVCVLYS